MSIKPATMKDVEAVTPQQLTTMTPPEVDRLFAALDGKLNRLDDARGRAFEALYSAMGVEQVQRGRSRAWAIDARGLEAQARELAASAEPVEVPERLRRYNRMMTPERYANDVRTALRALDDNAAESQRLHEGPRATLMGEWDRRGGWTRFHLVQDGHIHRGVGWRSDCHTLRPTTVLAWQPHLSGKTDAEAVKALGPYLCTFCFPEAPTDWKKDPADAKKADNCEASGTSAWDHMTPEQRRKYSKYATCHLCGKPSVSITSTWKYRAHKPQGAK